MKQDLLEGICAARALYETLPADQLGAVYLDRSLALATPDPAAVVAGRLLLHRASLRGAWPAAGPVTGAGSR